MRALHIVVHVLNFLVGIGGTYDCTNIITNPIACGITTLDIDHTAILGKTVEEICLLYTSDAADE